MKIITSHKIISTRIAKNLVRYEFAADYKSTYAALIAWIKSDDSLTLLQLREMSSNISSTASSKTRNKTAESILSMIGAKKSKTKAKTEPKATKSTKRKSAEVIPLVSKRAQVLADLQKRDEIRALLKLLQG